MKRLFFVSVFFLSLFSAHSAGSDTDVTLQGAIGKLAVTVHKPELKSGEKCPIVIMCHGFGGDRKSGLFTSIADTLKAHGIASILFDFNAHGESEGRFRDMTVPNEIEDAKCIYNYVASLPYVSKVAVVGHSQGGVVSAMLAGELGGRKIKAVVLMAPAAVLRDDAIRGNTFGAQYNPLDPPEVVRLFGNRELGRDYIKTAFSLPIYETSEKYDGPACIIHGTGDRIVPYTYGERFHHIWKDSELHLLEAYGHGFEPDWHKASMMAAAYLIKKLKR